MGLTKDILEVLNGKLSKLGELNAAVAENSNIIYVRDNELLEVATILSGNPYAGLFYNVDSEKYILWNFEEDRFKQFVFEDYSTVYYKEDFEGGVLPAGWTVVDGGENDWEVGTAAASSGLFGLYISNDGGTTNQYSSVGAGLDVSHAYFDIDLPSGINAMFLVFDWRCEGEVGFDASQVFNCPTTFTPTANVEVVDGVDGDRIGKVQYNDQSTFVTELIEIPIGQAGTTRRFVFSWRNDSTIENQPPMAIDNVQIVYR